MAFFIFSLSLICSEKSSTKTTGKVLAGVVVFAVVVLCLMYKQFAIPDSEFKEVETFINKNPDNELGQFIKPMTTKGYLTKEDEEIIKDHIFSLKSELHLKKIEQVKMNILNLVGEK